MLVKLQILAPPQTEWLKTREGGTWKCAGEQNNHSWPP